MKQIKLGRKEIYAIVDDDFKYDKRYCLSLTSHGYARANIYKGKVDGKYKYEYAYLHHLVVGKPPKGLVVDHINRNKLDNRRANLRFCLQSNNARNKESTSGYKGVHYQKHNKKNKTGKVWVAQITANYKCNHLGSYKTPEAAARAYDNAAKRLHGEYATLNFPASQ